MSTVFSKIVSGEIPCYKVFEDKFHVAFLDIYPEVMGQVVVIPKQQTTSKFSSANPELLTSTTLFAQQVATILESKLPNILRVIVKIEGLDIDHLHLKLYPVTQNPNHVSSAPLQMTQTELTRILHMIKD